MLDRLADAWKALRGRLTSAQVVGASIRGTEAVTPLRIRHKDAQLVARYSKYVSVAASRNGAAIASTNLCVYTDAKGSARKQWDRRRVDRKRLLQSLTPGTIAHKAVDHGDEREQITDPEHPAVKLFSAVNPEMSWFELAEATEIGCGLTGRFYWADIVGPNGWPVELWPLYPQFIDVNADKRNFARSYTYGRGTEVEIEIDAGNVTPFKRPNPNGNPWVGMGDLAKCLTEADLSAAFSQYALNAIDNGAQPGLVINAPNMSRALREDLVTEIARRADGVRNAARTLILSLPKDSTIQNWVATGIKEAGFLAGQSEETCLTIISACFDMPSALIKMEDMNLANGKMALGHWQKFGILPRLRRMENAINERLMPKFRKALGDESLVVCFDDPVDKDYEIAAARVVSLVSCRPQLISVNEGRLELGYETSDDPKADELSLEEPAPVLPEGGVGGGKPDEKPDDKADPDAKALTPPEPVVRVETVVQTVTKFAHDPRVVSQRREWDAECGHCSTKAKRDDADAIEAAMRERVSAVFQRSADTVAALAAETGSATYAIQSTPFAQQLAEAVGPYINRAIAAGYDEAVSQAAAHGAELDVFNLANTRAVELARSYNIRLAQEVTQTVSDRLQTIIADAIQNGTAANETVSAIKEAMGSGSDYAADRIARSEISRASAAGRHAGWKDSGMVAQKEWILSGDPCPLCVWIAENNATVGIDEPFVALGSVVVTGGKVYFVDYMNINGGDAHPNCSCGTAPVFSKEVDEESTAAIGAAA